MRIISTFHDYYDVVQGQGQDLDLVYLRTPKEVVCSYRLFPGFLGNLNWDKGSRFAANDCVIGFCGKIYPLFALSYGEDHAFCYNIDDVDSFVNKHIKKRRLKAYYDNKKHYSYYQIWPKAWIRKSFDKFFVSCYERKDAFKQLFYDHRTPIFVYEHKKHVGPNHTYKYYMVIDAQLKSFEFFKVIDVFTAFQEIQMFLGSLAVPLKEMPVVPDRIMLEAKGFNKWSFRKEKS